MPEKIFHLQPWNPHVVEVEHALVVEIHTVVPELEILFMGAAALGLPGKNDIDLDILCNHKDLSTYTDKLSQILGEPKAASVVMSIWEFEKDGFEVDCILSDPATSHVPDQRKVFKLLKGRPDLLEEYRNLKIAWDGLTYPDYEAQKKQFFARITVK